MKQLKKCVNISILLAVAVLIVAMSLAIEWYGDVLLYQFSFADCKPIDGISSIFYSQFAHYLNVNGRFVAHFFVQIFATIPYGQQWFAVFNGAMYVALIALLLKYAGGDIRNTASLVTASLLVLFFCDTSYLPNHQIGYVWMSVTLLVFLILYRKRDDADDSTQRLIMLFLVGLVAGNGNEAMNVGIGAALFFDVLVNRRKYSKRQIVMFVGFAIGTAFLCLSPSRFKLAVSSYRPGMLESMYMLVTSLRAFWVLVLTLIIMTIRKETRLSTFVRDNWQLLTAMAVIFVFNLLVTIKSNRQLFGVELISAILTIRLLKGKAFNKLVQAVGVVIIAIIYVVKFAVLAEFKIDERQLRNALEESRDTIYIDLIHHNAYVHPCEELTYHDNVNVLFHVATIADDLDGIGRFYTREVSGSDLQYLDEIRLYPTAFKEIKKAEVANRVIEVGNGVYMLLRDKKNPAKFILHRSYDLCGVRWPMADYEVPFENVYRLDTDDYNVLVTTFPVPLMHVDSLTIKQP